MGLLSLGSFDPHPRGTSALHPKFPSNSIRPWHRSYARQSFSRFSAAGDDDGGAGPQEGSGSGSDSALAPEDVDVVMKFYSRASSSGRSAGEAERIDASSSCFSNATAPVYAGSLQDEVLEKTQSAAEEMARDEAARASVPNETTTELSTQVEETSLAPEPKQGTYESSNLMVTSPQPHSSESSSEVLTSQIARLQERLLEVVSSLDRGSASTDEDVKRVDNLVKQLESVGGPVVLSWQPSPNSDDGTMKILDGRWRLIFSSGFASGNLGGRRPGPPSSLLPLTLGQVYQDINVATGELDNVVTLTAKLSLASLPGVDAQPPSLTARLQHTFSVEGACTVRIVFENTVINTAGGIAGWLDALPQASTPQLPEWLRGSSARTRGGTFDVTFLDSKMRVTRGDRGELRIFLKD